MINGTDSALHVYMDMPFTWVTSMYRYIMQDWLVDNVLDIVITTTCPECKTKSGGTNHTEVEPPAELACDDDAETKHQ